MVSIAIIYTTETASGTMVAKSILSGSKSANFQKLG